MSKPEFRSLWWAWIDDGIYQGWSVVDRLPNDEFLAIGTDETLSPAKFEGFAWGPKAEPLLSDPPSQDSAGSPGRYP